MVEKDFDRLCVFSGFFLSIIATMFSFTQMITMSSLEVVNSSLNNWSVTGIFAGILIMVFGLFSD